MFLLALFPIVVIFLIIAYLVYMGAFLPIPIEEKMVGPFNFLYKEINGKDFSLIGKTTKEIAEELKQHNFTNLKPMQIFYPDEEKRLAEIGFIVQEKVNNLGSIKSKTIPSTFCMTTTFPWRNSLSFIFGFMKVDPTLQNTRKANNYSKTEAIVLLNEDTIHYLQPVRK